MLSSFSFKKHKYETQDDLKRLSPEDIVSLNPNDVGFYIENSTGNLTKLQSLALVNLLQQKKLLKADPNFNRQKAIQSFLTRHNIKSSDELNDVLMNAHSEAIKDLNERDQIAALQNRMNKLGGKSRRKYRRRRRKTRRHRRRH